MKEIHLTDRALYDLAEIRSYSMEQFGDQVASRYLAGIEESLQLIQEHPGVLQSKGSASEELCFFPVQKHHLVCIETDEAIFVVTITNSQINLLHRLYDLEPTLLAEAKALHAKLNAK